jgi:hypothetical protein
MIKKLVFIFASFIIFHSRGDAQSTFNDISGVSIGYSQLGPSEAYTINAEYYKIFREHYTLNYSVGVGYVRDGGIMVQGNASLFGAAAAAIILNDTYLGYGLGTLLLAIPEGVGMYVEKQHKLHASVNPLRAEYWYRGTNYREGGNLGLNLAVRAEFRTQADRPLIISPKIGTTLFYFENEKFPPYTVQFSLLFALGQKEGYGNNNFFLPD